MLAMHACLPVGAPLLQNIPGVCYVVPLVRRRKMKLATLVLAHEKPGPMWTPGAPPSSTELWPLTTPTTPAGLPNDKKNKKACGAGNPCCTISLSVELSLSLWGFPVLR